MDYSIYMNILDKEALTKTRGKVDWFWRRDGKLVPVTKDDVKTLIKALSVAGEKAAKALGFDTVEEARNHLKDESVRISLANGFLEWKKQQHDTFIKEYNYEIKRYEHALKFNYLYFTIYKTADLDNFKKVIVKSTPHTEFEYGSNTYVIYVKEGQDPLGESVKEEFFKTLFEAIPELSKLE
jgi:hypothetical protein